MGVTIKDVAKTANVAPSTVSRVIANNPRISEATKTKVREAMNKLGYHPNFSARSLANQNTQAIGVVMPSSGNKTFQNPFFPEVIRGISAKAHDHQFALYMTTGNSEQEILDGVIDMVQGRRVDGIILLYSRVNDQIMAYLQESDLPFVVIGKPYQNVEGITHVDNDNIGAAKQATEYLIQRGHRQIGFVGGDLDLVVTVDRLQGYQKAIERSGLSYNGDYVVHGEFLEEGGRQAVNQLLSISEPPTGLVVTDDLMALGILNALNEMGVDVPHDMSVVSFNNVMLAELSTPSLTSVGINIFSLGFEAVNCLIEKITDPETEPKRMMIPYEVIERNSVHSG
ncbi:LacI family DNA-binding transcriptional regulator [Tuberibacillus sp. Marseille-P3662]|uniref:LacI family DNA-binding transcriptional regulator n=1 Tax=Tuberibacillus sp. Marseille-P3662 TaxID=1965358 RepID=UPI000A1CCDE8|nr:LacI family DNA-binding transcriptional regulator [Tuberibacillus sp. Marseille-P3662]